MKRFGTQLKQLLSGLNKDERLTPTEFIEKVNNLRSNIENTDGIIEAALKQPRFLRKIMKAYRRSPSGRVVLYTRKGEPMVMTLERMNILQKTVKTAIQGLRKYYDSRKVALV